MLKAIFEQTLSQRLENMILQKLKYNLLCYLCLHFSNTFKLLTCRMFRALKGGGGLYYLLSYLQDYALSIVLHPQFTHINSNPVYRFPTVSYPKLFILIVITSRLPTQSFHILFNSSPILSIFQLKEMESADTTFYGQLYRTYLFKGDFIVNLSSLGDLIVNKSG